MSKTPVQPSIGREALMRRVWDEPLSVVARELDLSANGLAKLCDRLLIPRPSRRYWAKSKAQRETLRPELPPAPPGVSEEIALGGRPSARRERTRLPPAERREQLLNEAARLVVTEGLAEVTIKRLARDVGISEAQAHNCFSRRIDLLIELARRELAELEVSRRGATARGHDTMTRVILSTVTYLHEAERRGPLLQALMLVPEIREALREQRVREREVVRQPIIDQLVTRYGISRGRAAGSNAVLTAVCLRAGSLLAVGKTDLTTAERLCIAMVIAGSRSNARAPRDADMTALSDH